jgi:acyl-CoA thioester hydrolase
METRKVCPFPEDIAANLAVMKTTHARLTKPQDLGRTDRHSGESETHETTFANGTRH